MCKLEHPPSRTNKSLRLPYSKSPVAWSLERDPQPHWHHLSFCIPNSAHLLVHPLALKPIPYNPIAISSSAFFPRYRLNRHSIRQRPDMRSYAHAPTLLPASVLTSPPFLLQLVAPSPPLAPLPLVFLPSALLLHAPAPPIHVFRPSLLLRRVLALPPLLPPPLRPSHQKSQMRFPSRFRASFPFQFFSSGFNGFSLHFSFVGVLLLDTLAARRRCTGTVLLQVLATPSSRT